MYRAREARPIRVGRRLGCLYLPELDRVRVLPFDDGRYLAGCEHFASLTDHAWSVGGRMGRPGHVVEDKLRALANEGLLVRLDELLDRARSNAHQSDSPAVVDTIAIVTCRRPKAALRAVESFLGIASGGGSPWRLQVFDDSIEPEPRRIVRDGLAALVPNAREANATLEYADIDDKRAFVERVRSRSPGAPAETLSFALEGVPGWDLKYGANRNAVLLANAGRAFVMTDDDTLGPLAVVQSGENRSIRFVSRNDPTELYFFESLHGALRAAVPIDESVFDVHSRWLGRSIGATLGERTCALEDESAEMLTHLAMGTGRIRLVNLGLYGDSGMGSPAYFLTMLEPTMHRLVCPDYERLRLTRAVERAAPAPTISGGGFFMTPQAAYDGRELLPPFLPIGRNEDGLFASMVRRLWPEEYIAHLPVMVRHEPVESRSFVEDQLWMAPGREVGTFVINAMTDHQTDRACMDRGERLSDLGRYFESLGTLPENELDELLRVRYLQVDSARMRGLAWTVRCARELPEVWLQDIEEAREQAREALSSGETPAPLELAPDPAEARARLRTLFGRFGELCRHWGRVMAVAESLRIEGLGLTREVEPR